MNQDITIVRSQIGLAFEKIENTGQWSKQQYAYWKDVPFLEGQRSLLIHERGVLAGRADYRNVVYAWRGIMTNTIVDDSVDTLMDLNARLLTEPVARQIVVADGTVFSGVTLHGMFNDIETACEWAENHIVGTWEVAAVIKP
jgi:hypothetical protein